MGSNWALKDLTMVFLVFCRNLWILLIENLLFIMLLFFLGTCRMLCHVSRALSLSRVIMYVCVKLLMSLSVQFITIRAEYTYRLGFFTLDVFAVCETFSSGIP